MFDWAKFQKDVSKVVPFPNSDRGIGEKAVMPPVLKPAGKPFDMGSPSWKDIDSTFAFLDRPYDPVAETETNKLMDMVQEFDDKTNFATLYKLFGLVPEAPRGGNNAALMQKMVMTVNAAYDDKKQTITPAQSKVIYDLFSCLTGQKKGNEKAISEEEETIDYLLKNTTFLSRCFVKQSSLITDLTLGFWKKYNGNFSSFIKSHDDYLTKTFPLERGETVERRGIDHILGNNMFAGRVMEIIPTHEWTNHVMLSLFIRALNKEAPLSMTETFVGKMDALPSGQEKSDRANLLFGFLVENQRECRNILGPDGDMTHFIHVIKCIKSPEMKFELSHLLHVVPDSAISKMIKELKTDADYQAFVGAYASNSVGIKEMMGWKKPNGESVVWGLYGRGKIDPDLMEKMVKTALRTRDFDFLIAPKAGALTEKFPAYGDVRGFLADMPNMALKFLNTFKEQPKGGEAQFRLAQEFIPSKAIQKKLAYRYQLAHQWVKNECYHRVAEFFFGTKADTTESVQPLMSQEDIDLFWTQADAEKKTVWHYLCQKKDKTFFRRNFQILHSSFIQMANQPDEAGKTPLDYASENLKFMQYIAEKIPAVKGLLSETNYTLEYQAPKKEKEEPVPEIKATGVEVAKIEEPVQKWTIQYYGTDVERKNDGYLRLIEKIVDNLPPPKSAAMRKRMKKETKKTVYDIPALKTHWNGKKWRIPYVPYDTTVYILPGIGREEAYTTARGQLIRGLATRLERELKSPTFITHHADKEPEVDKINQKH